MKRILLFMAALLPFAALAQPNYHEGYVIKNNGDTVKGFINYREWAYSPEYVEFKIGKTDASVLKFTADSIKEFGVTGFEAYRSYIGDITLNKNIFPNVPFGIDTSHAVRAIFLKPVRKGLNVDLYYNNEINKDRFFISEKGGPLVELKYYEYYTSASAEAFGNAYKTQLQLLAAKYNVDNNKVADDLYKAKYDAADIGNIADDINGIDPAQRQKADSARSARSLAHLRFIAGVAGNYTTNVGPTTTTFTPKFNAGIDLLLNPNVQQLIIRLELAYTWTSGYYPAFEQTQYGIVTVNEKFTQYSFSASPQLIFNVYNTDKFKFYLGAGADLNFATYNGQFGLTPFWVSFPLQTGIVLNRRWEVFVSYAFKSQYLGSSYYNTNQSDCIGIKHLF